MKRLSKLVVLLLTSVILFTACRKDEVVEEEISQPVAEETPAALETYQYTPDTFPRMDGTLSTEPLGQAIAAVMLGQSREDSEPLTMFTWSSQAFRNLADGLCDIIITGEPSPGVLNEISAQDFRYDTAPIAADALVFIVSASNPVDNLSSEQIKSIYSGDLTEWQETGGSDLSIIAFQRNEEATSQILMEKLVMDWSNMADAPMQEISSFFFSDNADNPSAIKGFDSSINAIGYTMYYYAANMNTSGGYKILSVDGITPGRDTIADGTYPFIGNYYASVSRDLPEDDSARILYNWLLSDEGQALISSEGYVSIRDLHNSGGDDFTEGMNLRWSVSTDDSYLTPYNTSPPLSKRLSDGALPELVPAAGYGRLLPYSSAVTMNDGSIYAVRYGFVTQDGVVVTDPVYDSITGAIYSTQSESKGKSAYRLHMSLPENGTTLENQTVQAACAEDGSWITDFKYVNIVFRQNVIFLMYGYDTFDIDVCDYSGNMLYNIMDLEWIDRLSEDAWPEHLLYGENEGMAFIPLNDGTYGMVEMLTGELFETDFAGAFMFSDGLIAVQPAIGGLWGFADKDLELVIPAQYVSEAMFTGGRATVKTPDGESHIIDKQGMILFSVEEGYIINSLPDNQGYEIYHMSDFSSPQFIFNNDLEEISYPPEILPLSSEDIYNYLYAGRFSCMTEKGTWLFSSGESYAMPASVHRLTGHSGDFVSYLEFDEQSGSRAGVMTLDGTVIFPPASNQFVSFVHTSDGNARITVNYNESFDDFGEFVDDSYKQLTYSLIDPSGSDYTVIKTGAGSLYYESALGLLYVLGPDHFTWLTAGGDTIVKIPSMAYTFD